jgi:hypothetical protein
MTKLVQMPPKMVICLYCNGLVKMIVRGTKKSTANAAWSGCWGVLEWAQTNGCPWNETTCANAALNGHLAILKWARNNGCPWDENTCTSAGKGGHSPILQYACENGCPVDS